MEENVRRIVRAVGLVILLGTVYYYAKNSDPKEHKYTLPALPYAYNALEPFIDAQTMQIHHTKHHQAYVNGLNEALDKYPELRKKPLNLLLEHIDLVPEDIQEAVRNYGGGHANHSFFWKVMTPKGTGEPIGITKSLINRYFESFDKFKKQFNEAALHVFGSGWVWLVLTKTGTLEIITTANQDSPLSLGNIPLLGLDVWEHAYYLKYQNKRSDYIDAWWSVVHWKQVEQNYKQSSSQFTRAE